METRCRSHSARRCLWRSFQSGVRLFLHTPNTFASARRVYLGGHMTQQTTTPAETSVHQPQPAEKLYMENTLLRIFGALFCHDAKRARGRTSTIDLNRGVREKHLLIRLDQEYGQPGPFAHKVAIAVIKKQSDYGKPVRRDIS